MFDPELLKKLADGPGPNVQPSTVRALATDLLEAQERISKLEQELALLRCESRVRRCHE